MIDLSPEFLKFQACKCKPTDYPYDSYMTHIHPPVYLYSIL